MENNPTVKARHGFRNIVVDDCPYCHCVHYHNYPIGGGIRLANCWKGEYKLVFEEKDDHEKDDSQ